MSFRDAYDVLCAGNGIHDASYVDKYYETLKYILEGHENEGVEFYKPYEDPPRLDQQQGRQARLRPPQPPYGQRGRRDACRRF